MSKIDAHHLKVQALLKEGNYVAARQLINRFGRDIYADKRMKFKQVDEYRTPSTLVFVCGLHRSGTTLLCDALSSRYEIARIAGAHVPEGEGQFLQEVFPAEKVYGGPGSFAVFPFMHFPPVLDEVRREETRDHLLRAWLAWADTPDDAFLEKSPPNIVRIPFFRSLFPEAKFIVWSRDPRAVTMATRKWHKLPVAGHMMNWSAAMTRAIANLESDCILSRYEDFCEDPEGELNRLANFCGLKKRPKPRERQQRYTTIKNTNGKYLEAFPPNWRFRGEVKPWQFFGYDF